MSELSIEDYEALVMDEDDHDDHDCQIVMESRGDDLAEHHLTTEHGECPDERRHLPARLLADPRRDTLPTTQP